MIIACDSNLRKLGLLQDNCKRLHITSALPVCCDLQNYSFDDSLFDRILLDAPCSCSGLFRRHPELKYKISPDKITRLSKVQLRILLNISKFLKKGGIIVYSTCSLEKEENESIIEKFLQKRKSFTIARCEKIEDRIKPDNKGIYRIFPDDFGTDGFSFAVLKSGDK